MEQLVLSLFPGIGLLDMAFELEGFCVVQDRDWIMGGDVRKKHFPAGRFDGVIGGPPCQAFSRLAHMVRQNGYEPKFGNLIPDFERVVSETQCQWFVMEQVPDAPIPQVDGYGVHSFIFNNRQLGETQNRTRRISFGNRGEKKILEIDVVVFESPDFEYAATGGSARPVAIGGSGKRKKFRDGRSEMPFNSKSAAAAQDLCRKQGLPDDFLERLPFTVTGKCKAIGNGVPIPMGRAIARAVKEAITWNSRKLAHGGR